MAKTVTETALRGGASQGGGQLLYGGAGFKNVAKKQPVGLKLAGCRRVGFWGVGAAKQRRGRKIWLKSQDPAILCR